MNKILNDEKEIGSLLGKNKELDYKKEKQVFVTKVLEIKRDKAMYDTLLDVANQVKINNLTKEEILRNFQNFNKLKVSLVEKTLIKDINGFFDLAKNITGEKVSNIDSDIEEKDSLKKSQNYDNINKGQLVAISSSHNLVNSIKSKLEDALKAPQVYDFVTSDLMGRFIIHFYSSDILLEYYANKYSSVREYLENPVIDLTNKPLGFIKLPHKEKDILKKDREIDVLMFINMFDKPLNQSQKNFLAKVMEIYQESFYRESNFNDSSVVSVVARDNLVKSFLNDINIQKKIMGADISQKTVELMDLLILFKAGGMKIKEFIDPSLLDTFIEEKNLSGILNVLTLYAQIKPFEFYNEKQSQVLQLITSLDNENLKNNLDSKINNLKKNGSDIGIEVFHRIDSAYKIYVKEQKRKKLLNQLQDGKDSLCDIEEKPIRLFEINLEKVDLLTNFTEKRSVKNTLAFLKNLELEGVNFSSHTKKTNEEYEVEYLQVHTIDKNVDKIKRREIEDAIISIFSDENFHNAFCRELVENTFRELYLLQKFKNDKIEKDNMADSSTKNKLSKQLKRPKV